MIYGVATGWLAIWVVGLVIWPLLATWWFEAGKSERTLVAFFWTMALWVVIVT